MTFDPLGFEPYSDTETPEFVHVTDSRPIESFYEVPSDKDAPRSCCLRAILVSQAEFTWQTTCPIHGRKDGGNAD